MLQGSKTLAFFPRVLGNTMNIHQEILSRLKNRLKLTQANAEHNSDVIIAFVPVVSRAGTDIEAALEKIPRTGRPVVLMVLHFTFDVNYIPPQSNQNINRDDVFALDLLCYEDLGLLRSLRNDEALKAVTDHLISIGGSPNTQLGTTSSQRPCTVHSVFPMVFGNTMNSHKLFMDRLSSKVKLHEVYSVNECDVIIAFVPIVSRAGTDVGAALEHIPRYSYKSIILVSLHHTFNPDYIAPDSRLIVNRSDVFAVDCLYHEDAGLLQSQHNDEALKRVIKHLGGEKSSYQETGLLVYKQATFTFFLCRVWTTPNGLLGYLLH
ncbi:uncharacterized protein LOC132874759 isoform X2 [Neoarius graeffei]|uniref:uncharacterized protein LOC132874759 isoform X2 n=1 Tax=Neoarius graeffei TaxID=443677 RepID=UPI00298C1B4D|nr:uncharacterized protein LOC132874759 isoform X2 [Neoarius graeffei]